MRPRTRTQYYPLEGGLDVVTPALSVKAGKALAMINCEPYYQGGYRRIPGYERFDGRPKPSAATFISFNIDTVVGLTLRDIITGDTSGATGTLIGIVDPLIAVTKTNLTFQIGETCNGGAFTILDTPTTLYAATVADAKAFTLEAEEVYREDIQEVPGAATVRGAWQRGINNYAIRDNVGQTAGVMHVASSSGWTTTGVELAHTLRFDTGLNAASSIVEGTSTLVGATSGATATIHKSILNGGSNAWDGSGEGYFALTNVVGTFSDGEILESPAATPVATANGINTEFAFPPGGTYRFLNHNFFGNANTYRTYGCNGVGAAFEIDENNVISPILMPVNPVTGEAPVNNTPFLIEEHIGHLFLAFEGGSLQHSAPGSPLLWSGFLGAGEFGLGDEITGINSIVGNVLIASTRRQTRGLFGTGIADWNLRLTAEQSGSILHASQKIDTVYSLDDLGITSVSRSEQFGDFISATVSKQIQPIVNSQRGIFTDSTIVRESNQYRLYFSDNSCLVMYVPAGSQTQARQSVSGRFAKTQFGFLSYKIPVSRIYNTEDETGTERTYFVTEDPTYEGYVFEDQIGRNFDGAPIASYVRTPFNQVGSPSYRKRFRRADLELNATEQLDIKFNSDLTYSAATVSSSVSNLTSVDIPELTIFGGGGFWNVQSWDDFTWDGQTVSSARAELRGSGENIGFLIFHESATAEPWVMQGITLHYDLRRLQR